MECWILPVQVLVGAPPVWLGWAAVPVQLLALELARALLRVPELALVWGARPLLVALRLVVE